MKMLRMATLLPSRSIRRCANLPLVLVVRAPLSPRTVTCFPLYRCFAVHVPPPAPSRDDDSKKNARAQHNDEEHETKMKGSGVKASDHDISSNPWRHFQAFSGMDEYMDVTLIHYKNSESKSGGFQEDDRETHEPHSPSSCQAKKQTKD